MPDGPLTSRLQHIQVGDELLISKNRLVLWCLMTYYLVNICICLPQAQDLQPFLSLCRDPEVYERFEKVILVHGVRHVNDLAYRDFLKISYQMMRFLANGFVKNSSTTLPSLVMNFIILVVSLI